ncbi:hypothetical protein [Amycolatopsis sp. NPDC059657]|uniref:hypothetical protein n=1 Tax=Amycolatopsis sp. NPDC059657 TaxID=3346899 RepID=UPI00366A6AA9
MKAVIAWWDLAGSTQTVASLRTALHRDGVEDWASIPGLVSKFWFSDPVAGRWGAVMVFASADHARLPLPPNRAAALIGRPPTVRLVGDVEALVTGPAVPEGDRPWQ